MFNPQEDKEKAPIYLWLVIQLELDEAKQADVYLPLGFLYFFPSFESAELRASVIFASFICPLKGRNLAG